MPNTTTHKEVTKKEIYALHNTKNLELTGFDYVLCIINGYTCDRTVFTAVGFKDGQRKSELYWKQSKNKHTEEDELEYQEYLKINQFYTDNRLVSRYFGKADLHCPAVYLNVNEVEKLLPSESTVKAVHAIKLLACYPSIYNMEKFKRICEVVEQDDHYAVQSQAVKLYNLLHNTHPIIWE